MRKLITCISIALLFVFVSVSLKIFFRAPALYKNIHFSQVVYDDQYHLLRLTLSKDQKYRVFVPIANIAPEIVDASLLQEDQYFRWHVGINPFSILKAAWNTYILQSRRIGASTITMQLARIRFHIQSKTVMGKIYQIFRALQLELHYSKNQILEAYLNLAPYGNNVEGVGAASLIYFGKSADHLNLPEALTLAVIPQNPNDRLPGQEHLKQSRDKLFKRWVLNHPEAKKQQALIALPLQLQNVHRLPFYAPHFVNDVLLQTPRSEQNIVTTLNLPMQTLFERIVSHYLNQKKMLGVSNASVLLLDTRNMDIKVLIGSANFFDKNISGQINGTTIKRSPGSTLKPFIYGLALDQGLIHPNTVLKDVPHSFGNYNPENFDYDFMGPIQAKEALVLSRNIPAIFLADQIKHPNLYEFLLQAHVTHLKAESYYGLSLALGGAELSMQELASLYAMLLNDGRFRAMHIKVHNSNENSQQLLSPEASFLVLDILKNTPRPEQSETIATNLVSWKTGTSSGFRDAWSIGVIGPYVLAVWIGNFDNTSNHAFVGKNIAAPLFFELIAGLDHEQAWIKSYRKKSDKLNLTKIPVCKASGLLPTRYCKETELSWFIPAKSPIKTDNIYREVAINKKTGLRTCRFDANTEFKVYEFWPSDFLKIFKEAGIARREPPSFDANCSPLGNAGFNPQITSPRLQQSYILRANVPNHARIPFSAVTDAGVNSLYWFIDDAYVGKSGRGELFWWQAKPGHYVVRIVDDHGRSDARDLIVQVES